MPLYFRHLRSLLLFILIFALALPTGIAFAAPGDCDDPIAGLNNSTVTCSSDPINPDDIVGLDLGDDTYVQNAGVTTQIVDGDSLDDGTTATGNGGNDHITIHGEVLLCVNGDNVDGDGGDDTIIISSTGIVGCSVAGDDADNGGDDTITIDGEVTGDIYGDYVDNNGGDDTITINGLVDIVFGDFTSTGTGGNDIIIVGVNGDVLQIYGDQSGGLGGNDTITIYGYVDSAVEGEDGVDTITVASTGDVGDLYGGNGDDLIYIYGYVDSDVDGEDDDDIVLIGIGSEVGGIIYGGSGADTLQLAGITQADLDALGLDPSAGSITIDGMTYFFQDFESLVGLLQLISAGARHMYANGSVFALADETGISIFADHGRVAFIDYAVIDAMDTGAMLSLSTPNSAGWYATVTDLGVNGAHTGNTLFQVNVYSAGGTLVGQFNFAN